MRRLSIRSKIILTLLLTGLACLAAGGLIGYRSGATALTDSVAKQLTAQREIKKQRVQAYIRNQLRFTQAVGGAPETIAATRALVAAFRDMHADLAANPGGEPADTVALTAWYNQHFLPRIDKIAGSHTPLEGLLPVDPVARRLQADYIARNPNEDGKRFMLDAAPGGSRYDVAHARYHPIMKRVMDTIGFWDINLMDAQTGDVVYGVDKEVDFGSNMYHGAFTQSGFARAARRALDPTNGGKAIIEDYALYMPSAFAPQMFTAVPVIADGQIIAVLVAQIDVSTLNSLLTDDNGWSLTGQGDSGEVQLVGEDHLMRSQSRFMATEPATFLAQIQANGTPTPVVDRIRAVGTTIMYLRVRNDAIDLALRNQTGVAQSTDTRGINSVFAYGPVEVAGLRWGILAKQDVAEAFAPLTRLNRDLLVAGSTAAILLTFLALGCAGLFMRPLRRVITGMQAMISGGSREPLPVHGTDEFAELAIGYNAMAATIRQRDNQVATAEARSNALLGNLYPAGLADRMRSGAELTAETVANVTVVVMWMDGLDALAADRTATEMSEVMNALLDVVIAAASSHGVEPVRSLGETQIAVCGLSTPCLDHATRALAWSQSAALAVQRLGADWAPGVNLRFGMASGEVDVLLLKRGHAAYDIWGRTLAVARRIAVDTEPGVVRVSESTYELLTDVQGFEPASPITAPVLGTFKIWARPILAQPALAKAGPAPRSQAAE